MDIGKAFTFVFEDDRWIQKILIAAGILVVGIVLGILIIPAFLAAVLLGGYLVEIARRVIRGDPRPLPEWDNWGGLIVDGIQFWVISIVYSLPAILLSGCVGLLTAMVSNNQDAQGLVAVLNAGSGCFAFLWGILAGIVLPAAVGSFVANNQLSAAFRFGDVLALVRNNLGTYLLTFVMALVAGIVGGLGLIVCLIGVLVTYPYSQMVTGHLYGQAYRTATGQAAQPVASEVV